MHMSVGTVVSFGSHRLPPMRNEVPRGARNSDSIVRQRRTIGFAAKPQNSD